MVRLTGMMMVFTMTTIILKIKLRLKVLTVFISNVYMVTMVVMWLTMKHCLQFRMQFGFMVVVQDIFGFMIRTVRPVLQKCFQLSDIQTLGIDEIMLVDITRMMTRTLVLVFHDPEQGLVVHILGNHGITFSNRSMVVVRRSGVWTMRRFHPTVMGWFVPRRKKPVRVVGFARYGRPHILDRSQQTVDSPNNGAGIKELTPSAIVPPGLAICRSTQDVKRMKSTTI